MLLKYLILIFIFVSNIYAAKYAVVNASVINLKKQDGSRGMTTASIGELKEYDSITNNVVNFSDGYYADLDNIILVDTNDATTMIINTSSCNLYYTPSIGEIHQSVTRGDEIQIVAHLKYGWSMNTDGKFILTHLLRNSYENKPKAYTPDIQEENEEEDEKDINLKNTTINTSRNTTINKNVDAKLYIKASRSQSTQEQLDNVIKTVAASKIRDKFYISKMSDLETEILVIKTKFKETETSTKNVKEIQEKIKKLEEQNRLLLKLLKDR